MAEEFYGFETEYGLLCWLAGIIDGEGSAGVYKTKTSYFTIVQIGNTEQELLYPFKKRYGGRISLRQKEGQEITPGIFATKDGYVWFLTAGRRKWKRLFEQCLLELLPYLRSPSKIQQFVECLIFIRCARERWEHLVPKHVQTEDEKPKLISIDEAFGS